VTGKYKESYEKTGKFVFDKYVGKIAAGKNHTRALPDREKTPGFAGG